MYLPRVLAIHDICSYGKCSETVAIPIISACGVEVIPLLTSIFSTNTSFEKFKMIDFTENMLVFLEHFKEIGLKFDGLYTGFLGSEKQIEYIKGIITNFRPKQIFIDPVMADNGVIYKTYTKEMCDGMRELAGLSDYVLPNLTESCILANEEYKTIDTSSNGIKKLATKIMGLGAKNIIITGIERCNKIYNCILTKDEYIEREIELLPFRMHGTGDLFSSVLTGGILSGHSLVESVDSAAKFVYDVMEYSQTIDGYHERGACFEPLLYRLHGGICK